MADRHNALARHLAIAFTLLVIYASLHPFSGWRDLGAPPLAWLTTGWLRYSTWFDIVLNVFGYLPFGFLWATVLQRRLGRVLAIPAITVLGALLSGTVETTQNYLPTRVSSNIDFGSNTLGTLFGAIMGARWGGALLSGGHLAALRERHIVSGFIGDSGLVLMGFWLLTQVNPESLLFGNGDLRRALGIEPALPFDVSRFAHIEAAIAAINALAVGLVLAALGLKARAVFAMLLLGVVIRALAAAILVDPAEALHWITSGNASGVAIGCAVLLPVLYLGQGLRRSFAAVALLLATVLVNLAPQNPYLAEAAEIWRQGHFLNFNGLTRLLSMLWPFLALAWLLLPDRDPWKKKTS
ncbi:VanZ family protein [Georgfuchsia toluolica]|uniref:VanZ family protein n=1 Tax=Georgfuchsia toluolica TaxID=424218 RepID=A0A916J4S7_9PROT|nr:VanZ family protein [Georgfuchsia toluolica]CAG4883966.1 VanZ family protein [Georgfuchsia toluolica]